MPLCSGGFREVRILPQPKREKRAEALGFRVHGLVSLADFDFFRGLTGLAILEAVVSYGRKGPMNPGGEFLPQAVAVNRAGSVRTGCNGRA